MYLNFGPDGNLLINGRVALAMAIARSLPSIRHMLSSSGAKGRIFDNRLIEKVTVSRPNELIRGGIKQIWARICLYFVSTWFEYAKDVVR